MGVTGQRRDLDRNPVVDWTITGPLSLDISANAHRRRDRVYTITVVCTRPGGHPSKEKAAIVTDHVP